SAVSGNAVFTYIAKTDWSFDAEDVLITGIRLNNKVYSFGGTILVNPTSLNMKNVAISDKDATYVGFVSYDGTPLQTNVSNRFRLPFSFATHFSDGGKQLFDLYVERTNEDVEMMADIRSFDLSRFIPGNRQITGNLSFVGDTDLKRNHHLSGVLGLSGNEGTASADIALEGAVFSLRNGSVTVKGNTFSGISLAVDGKGTFDGAFHFDSPFSFDTVTPKGSSANVDFHGTFPAVSSVPEIDDFLNTLRNGPVSLTMDVKDLSVFGRAMPLFDDSSLTLAYDGKKLSLGGRYLYGWYDPATKTADITLDDVPSGFGFHLNGCLNSKNLACTLDKVSLDLTWINKFMKTPEFVIDDGSAKGMLFVTGPMDNPQVFGHLSCDTLEMQTLYLPDEKIYARNIFLWADGSTLSSALQRGYVTNIKTGKTNKGTFQMAINLNGLSFDSIVTNIDFSDGNINFYMPITDSDIEIHADVSGNMRLEVTANNGTFSSGTGVLENATMTIGMKDCPSWYVSSTTTSTDFWLRIGKNNRIFYPNTPSPMFSATLQEGQDFHFVYDHIRKQFQMQGDLAIRNGEIFYFQKNFFITEGSISFPNNTGESFQPIVNLRAKMRNYDSSGNPVDIYLVLKNNVLTNFTPTFESSPQKNLEEIMSILGQSILPTEAYGGVSLYRVASLATVATDVAQRMGWIREGSMTNLSETIRSSLGLDMFTLHSNVLQNIIIDALPGSSAMTISPIARYLNNTTVFMGKYLGQDMFLQVLLHLTAVDKNSGKARTPFLVNDLALNLEMSLQWDTPLCTYSLFTQPNELSLVQILDTIGFSITKRIVLR
ncbi:MAG: translocation/assembly module TamB domain-containing protein, partial [Sphaerochaetaceae bacterium]